MKRKLVGVRQQTRPALRVKPPAETSRFCTHLRSWWGRNHSWEMVSSAEKRGMKPTPTLSHPLIVFVVWRWILWLRGQIFLFEIGPRLILSNSLFCWALRLTGSVTRVLYLSRLHRCDQHIFVTDPVCQRNCLPLIIDPCYKPQRWDQWGNEDFKQCGLHTCALMSSSPLAVAFE